MPFLENYSFKYPWRKYQARVLDEASKYLSDNKINIVAAPGAGKTVLGLELLRRINKNVLILSPSITIKNQWVDRFLTLFVGDAEEPDFISTDIYNLNRFNVATYQALHYAYNKQKLLEEKSLEEEEDKEEKAAAYEYNLIESIKEKDIKVVILDEAHHLRAAWHKSLMSVLSELTDITTISLTATPPYDSNRGEWDKYLSVCGPIDSSITVPELVAAGDLCPHQDFVIFNQLSVEEERRLYTVEEAFGSFLNDLKANSTLIEYMLSMKGISDFSANAEIVLDNPRYYSSIIIFLNEIGGPLDSALVNTLGGGDSIPRLSNEWLEIMLQGIIYEDKEFDKTIVKNIKLKLNKIGGIANGSVCIKDSDEVKKIMASSVGKMKSITDIVLNEYGSLENNLSMVVLTDYVREKAMTDASYDNKIGVVPIFKRVVAEIGVSPNSDEVVAGKICNIAVMSGKLKIIPKTLIPYVEERVSDCTFNDTVVTGYVSISTTTKNEQRLVSILTEAMNEKRLNIIIGTVALLGEGWDCKSVNSLILASFVGSYMLSNQMRGRAIRIDKDENKVSNIWHLASVVKNDYNSIFTDMSMNDFKTLKRRFRSFIGISYEGEVISNGIERLSILSRKNIANEVDEINKEMYRQSRTRLNTKKRWHDILEKFGNINIEIIHTLKTEKPRDNRFKVLAAGEVTHLVANIIMITIIAAVLFFVFVADLTFLMVVIAIVLLSEILNTANVIGRLRIYKDFRKHIRNVSKAVLDTLVKLSYIKSDNPKIVNIDEEENSDIYEVGLTGATEYENNLFVTCLKEVYERVDNQRYIITYRRGRNSQYFAVPSLFGDKKQASLFFGEWCKRLSAKSSTRKQNKGIFGLVYTRSENGRKALLMARRGSFDYTERFHEKQKAVKDRNWK